jgi:hypothetical protein
MLLPRRFGEINVSTSQNEVSIKFSRNVTPIFTNFNSLLLFLACTLEVFRWHTFVDISSVISSSSVNARSVCLRMWVVVPESDLVQ